MAADPIDDKELGKRLSAGRGYLRETVTAFAERLDVNPSDLRKWELGDFGSNARFRTKARKRADAVRKVKAESGLPDAFFVIDFNELDRMAELWRRAEGDENPSAIDVLRDLEGRDDDQGEPGGTAGSH